MSDVPVQPGPPGLHPQLRRHLEAGLEGLQRGAFDEAAVALAAALEIDARHPDALHLLALARLRAGRTAEALDLFRRAVEAAPNAVPYRMNLGNALLEAGDAPAAVDALRLAQNLVPDDPDVAFNLGRALRRAGDHDAAAAAFARAAAGVPGDLEAGIELARCHAYRGSLQEADRQYGRCLAARHDPAVELQRALAMPVIAQSADEIVERRAALEAVLDDMTQRPGFALEDPLREVGTTAFFLSYQGRSNRALLEKLAAVYLRVCPGLAWSAPAAGATRSPRGRLRIGFVSCFLHRHSVGRAYGGLITGLDRSRFESVAIFAPPYVRDEVSESILRSAGRALVLPPDLRAAREMVAGLGLDVLVYPDLGMDAFTYFLAFSRLAPVQCTTFGHPDTSGIPTIDYFVSAGLAEREDAGADYSERLVRIPGVGSPVHYAPPPRPASADRAQLGLPREARLYACLQTLFKLHPDVDAMFAEILRADARGLLLLAEPQVPHWRRLFEQRWARHYPDLLSRLHFLPHMPWERYLQVLAAADVVLDTPHFNGGNSTLDALWVGTPVVTLPGELARARHGLGLCRAAGLEDCIATGPRDYTERALRFASDPGLRSVLARDVRERQALLFAAPAVTRGFENFFEAAARSPQTEIRLA